MQAQPEERLSDLTLANIEALGYDTIGEAIDAGCAGCWGTTSSCYAQVTNLETGEIVATAKCPGFYPG